MEDLLKREKQQVINLKKKKEKSYNAYSNKHYTKINRTRDKEWWGVAL